MSSGLRTGASDGSVVQSVELLGALSGAHKIRIEYKKQKNYKVFKQER